MQIARCDCSRARTEPPESELRTNDGDAFNSKEVDFAGEVTDDCVERGRESSCCTNSIEISDPITGPQAQQTPPGVHKW